MNITESVKRGSKGSLRVCSVRGCNTGSYNERRLKAETGQRPTTIFKPPFKDPTLLEKWSSTLGSSLREKDRVCELHFADKDVIKTDYTRLPDGSIFSLPRIKYRLVPGAIPLSPHIQENETGEQGMGNQTSDETKESFLDDHQYFIATKEANQCVYYNKEVAACFMIPSIKDTLMKRKKEVSKTNIRNDHNNDGMNHSTSDVDDINDDTNDDINYNTIDMKDNTIDDTNDSTNDNTIDDSNDNIDDNTIEYINDNANDNTTDDTNDEVMEFEEILNESDIMPKPKLKIQEILDHLLEIPLPKTWSWMNYTKTDNGITFSQIDCKTRQVRCFIEIHEDLSKMLHTGDDKVTLEIEFQLTSAESISRMLQTVTRMKICSGTGIERESRDEDCTGVIVPNEEYKCARSFDRCVSCRKLRLKVMQSRDTKDINVKYLSLKKKYDVLRRKSKHLEERLDAKTTRLKAITEMIKSVNKYSKNYQPES